MDGNSNRSDHMEQRSGDKAQKLKPPKWQGNIDGIHKGRLYGWVRDSNLPAEHVEVGLYADEVLLARATANEWRADLQAAEIGAHGYGFPLDGHMLIAARAASGRLTVGALNDPSNIIGNFDLSQGSLGMAAAGTSDALVAQKRALRLLREALNANRTNPYIRYSHSFAERMLAPSRHRQQIGVIGEVNRPQLSKFVDYVRHQFLVADRFQTDNIGQDVDDMLKWYLTDYCAFRKGLKPPLSTDELTYLNEIMRLGDSEKELTRATWMFLMKEPERLAALMKNDSKAMEALIYWWSVEAAHTLGATDCLVPDHYAAILSKPDGRTGNGAYPLSPFMRLHHLHSKTYSHLDLHNDADREVYSVYLLLEAISRPDLLRFIPNLTLDLLFDVSRNGWSVFELCLTLLDSAESEEPMRMSAETYREIILRGGFDMKSGTFTSVTPKGRLQVSCLPPVAQSEPVDLQVIGPLRKASGLGQAARLSAAAASSTGYTTNFVDFSLENPQPEGFSGEIRLSAPKRARVNLIHLNAETLPTALAYMPDVFTGAYNIGYFFWELDSPAKCQRLALEVLDEVWMASEFGVSIYQPHCDIPVTNVGMCYEEPPELDRATAREMVRERFRVSDDCFVFLVTFDAFSYVQRKNPIGVIDAFQLAFPTEENVKLVIKTQNRHWISQPLQIKVWHQIEERVTRDRRIVVMNETLQYKDVLNLKKGCDCYVSLHRSEGWGFGMIEAMNLGIPVLATAYSANLEYCTPDNSWLVRADEVPLFPEDYIYVSKGQKWGEPDIEDAARQMRQIVSDPDLAQARARQAKADVSTNFSTSAISRRYKDRLGEILDKTEK